MLNTSYYVFNSVLVNMKDSEKIPCMIPASGIKVFKIGKLIHLVSNVKHRSSYYCESFEIYGSVGEAKNAFDKLSGDKSKLTQQEKMDFVIDHYYSLVHKPQA